MVYLLFPMVFIQCETFYATTNCGCQLWIELSGEAFEYSDTFMAPLHSIFHWHWQKNLKGFCKLVLFVWGGRGCGCVIVINGGAGIRRLDIDGQQPCQHSGTRKLKILRKKNFQSIRDSPESEWKPESIRDQASIQASNKLTREGSRDASTCRQRQKSRKAVDIFPRS